MHESCKCLLRVQAVCLPYLWPPCCAVQLHAVYRIATPLQYTARHSCTVTLLLLPSCNTDPSLPAELQALQRGLIATAPEDVWWGRRPPQASHLLAWHAFRHPDPAALQMVSWGCHSCMMSAVLWLCTAAFWWWGWCWVQQHGLARLQAPRPCSSADGELLLQLPWHWGPPAVLLNAFEPQQQQCPSLCTAVLSVGCCCFVDVFRDCCLISRHFLQALEGVDATMVFSDGSNLLHELISTDPLPSPGHVRVLLRAVRASMSPAELLEANPRDRRFLEHINSSGKTPLYRVRNSRVGAAVECCACLHFC
jgi:hypothetical protein